METSIRNSVVAGLAFSWTVLASHIAYAAVTGVWTDTSSLQVSSGSTPYPRTNGTNFNSLWTESTYRLQVRSSYGTAQTFYFNRPANNTGSDNNEAGLSNAVATEIHQ